MRNRKNGKKPGIWDNFFFWIRRLWKKSPLFVCLYLAEIPVWVGIYLLDAYLPSVLVEDITAGKSLGAVTGRLLAVGGTMTVFRVVQDWLQKTEELKSSRIRRENSEELVGAAFGAVPVDTGDGRRERAVCLWGRHIWETVGKQALAYLVGAGLKDGVPGTEFKLL